MRIEAAREEEYLYTKEKYENTYEFIDIKGWNTFSANESISKMKCYYGFNIVGLWDSMINERASVAECPRCRDDEI